MRIEPHSLKAFLIQPETKACTGICVPTTNFFAFTCPILTPPSQPQMFTCHSSLLSTLSSPRGSGAWRDIQVHGWWSPAQNENQFRWLGWGPRASAADIWWGSCLQLRPWNEPSKALGAGRGENGSAVLLAVRPKASYLTSLCLLLICEKKLVITSIAWVEHSKIRLLRICQCDLICKRVFSGIIKLRILRRNHPESVANVLTEEKGKDRGERHVKTEAKGRLCVWSWESWEHPAWEQVQKDSPQAIRGKMVLRTRGFQTSGFRKHCEKGISLALHLPISY